MLFYSSFLVSSVSHTINGQPYMSPELFGDAKVGTAVDMWAVGVVAYELLVGGLPFTGTVRRSEGSGSGSSGGCDRSRVSSDSSGSIVSGCSGTPDSYCSGGGSSVSPPPPQLARLRADNGGGEVRAKKEQQQRDWRERLEMDVINGEYEVVADGLVGDEGRGFIDKVRCCLSGGTHLSV